MPQVGNILVNFATISGRMVAGASTFLSEDD